MVEVMKGIVSGATAFLFAFKSIILFLQHSFAYAILHLILAFTCLNFIFLEQCSVKAESREEEEERR